MFLLMDSAAAPKIFFLFTSGHSTVCGRGLGFADKKSRATQYLKLLKDEALWSL